MGSAVVRAEPSALALNDPLADTGIRNLVHAWLLSVPSVNTRKAYANDLGYSLAGDAQLVPRPDGVGWFPWLRQVGCDLLSARRAHVDAWAEHQRRGSEGVPPVAPKTLARRLAAVSSLYGYLIGEEITDHNPVKQASRPDIDPDYSPTTGLDREQARQVWYAAGRVGDTTEAVLVSLLLHCGLRASEAAEARCEGVAVSDGHRVLRLVGKGGVEQQVALPSPTAVAIDRLLGDRAAAYGVTVAELSGPLLRNSEGGSMTRENAARIVAKVGRRAGLPMPLTPHMLRHTFVTLSLDAGVPLRDVQDSARHRDPRTTRRYDRSRGKLNRSASYALAAYLED